MIVVVSQRDVHGAQVLRNRLHLDLGLYGVAPVVRWVVLVTDCNDVVLDRRTLLYPAFLGRLDSLEGLLMAPNEL